MGGILHWGRENGPDLEWFREKIREAYGGRAPKVLDPFAGGGAIPLEAMRLGCEATAIDINPVAWFILKCTLEYPQKLAGQTRPLPDFALRDREFMEEFFKAQGLKGAALQKQLDALTDTPCATPAFSRTRITQHASTRADLAWHVRAWGRWVLSQARRELAPYLPDLCRLRAARRRAAGQLRGTSCELVPLTRGRHARSRRTQCGVQRGVPGGPAQPALGGQADGGLPVGAHRDVQELPRDGAAAEDPLAVQEGQQAGAC